MLLFLLRRLAVTLPVFLVVALVVFLMLRLAPGDPAILIAGDAASPEKVAQMREQLGLNNPLPVQFVHWVWDLVRGDLGTSFYFNKPVSTLIAQRIEPTLSLAILTILLTVMVAIPIGVVAAWKHRSWFDRTLMGFSVTGLSIPSFVVAYLLIWLFSMKLDWLPVQGYNRLDDGLWPWLRHLILPSVTLAVIYVALIARVTRAAVVEALQEDYIRTARAKGITESQVLVRHALRNCAVPVVTVLGIGIALLISGVVVTETVYTLPGLGLLTVDAVLSRDFPLIQGLTLFFSAVYVMINLLVDLSYLALDPRIRY